MDTTEFFTQEQAGFAGDWHANSKWANRCLHMFADAGIRTVYHVGDFGIDDDDMGTRFRAVVSKVLAKRDMLLIVVPGNHENYDYLESDSYAIDQGFLVNASDPRIWYAPRGHLWTQNSVRFAAMGGAYSIDREYRTKHHSWWPQEEITECDVLDLQNNLIREGWDKVDIMITHDSPKGADVGRKLFKLPAHIEYAANRQRMMLRKAVDLAKPTTLVHGHWHKYIRTELNAVEYETSVIGLTCDGMQNNLMIAEIVPVLGLTNPVFS